VAFFAVPGAFTPGCSKTHCPSFVLGAAKLKQKGIDAVYCTAVNGTIHTHLTSPHFTSPPARAASSTRIGVASLT
jgi:hypothetical protein